MGRSNRSKARRTQASKRTRVVNPELELMVRFAAARDRDRLGMGR